MTTAPAAPQEQILYGPDGQALTSSTPTRAAIEEPAAKAGDWRAVHTSDNATVWEKTTTPQDAETDGYAQRIADLEDQLARNDRPTPAPEAPAAARHPEPAQAAPAPVQKARKGFDHWGPWIALWAAVGLTASGEYALAQFVGFGGFSFLLPIGIDVYVIQAFRRHRDVAVALILMVVTNALVHLAEAGLFGVRETTAHGETTYQPLWWLIVLVSGIAPFIVWRVHRITETKRSETKETGLETTATARETETSRRNETTETKVSTRSTETTSETNRKVSPTPRIETETQVSPRPAKPETSETKPRETRETSRSPQPRKTTPAKVSAIGDRETETKKLLDLMKSRGGEMKVSLDDAINETGRPKATAAKRLKAARDQYLAETA